jgi:hypothetical protein
MHQAKNINQSYLQFCTKCNNMSDIVVVLLFNTACIIYEEVKTNNWLSLTDHF